MDAQIRAVKFFLSAQAYADQLLQHAIDQIAAGKSDRHTEQRAAQLRHEAHAASAAKRLEAKYPCGYPAPCAAQTMQRPHAEHVVDLPAVLRQGEHHHEQRSEERRVG